MDTQIVPHNEPRTLYLSLLILDMRRRDVWRLLGDTYALHQRILMAYPERDEGGAGRVLFRADGGKGEARVLVQSDREPNWSPLREILAEPIRGPKPWSLWKDGTNPIFTAGQRLRYCLRANPTFCQAKDTPAVPATETRSALAARFAGRRYAYLTRKDQAAWLARKGEAHGFSLPTLPSGDGWLDAFYDEPEKAEKETPFDIRITPMEWQYGYKPNFESRIKHYGVDFEGTLTVTDPARLAAAVTCGIGPAKGFGFGLLSLARV